MKMERTSSISRLTGMASLSRRSVQLSEDARLQLASMKRSVRRQGTNWSLLFRRLTPAQHPSSIAKAFQTRAHNTTDLAVAALEVAIALAATLQLSLTFKAPFWRQNRACTERADCSMDLSDGSFWLPNVVRLAILVLGLTRAWVRIRFLLKTRKCVRQVCIGEWLGKLLAEIVSGVLFPFPGVEEVVGRHASGVFLLLTLSVAVRPIFWRQLSYFPYPIRQQEKVASFSGNLEFSYRSFVFKKVMDDNPLLKITVFLVLLFSFGSYVVLVVETIDGACTWPEAPTDTPVTSSSAVCDELSGVDALWLLAATIVPIGYGDTVPRTAAGRAVVVLSAVVAVCLNAMFFSTIIRKFSFSSMEARVHTFLYRMELYGKKDLSAVLAVQATFRFHKSYKRSLIWHQQMRSSVLHRPLSARLPNEVKKKLYISRFQASLKDIMKYDTDGDPLNAFVKHVEVITAALGTSFMDITWLKKLSARRQDALADRRPKLLRSTFIPTSGFSASPFDAASTSTSMPLTPEVLRCSGGGSIALAVTSEPSSGANGSATFSLPSRVEEPQPITQQPSPTRPLKPAETSLGLSTRGSSSTGGVPAAWGEEMLRRCELTLTLLRRIERDARDTL